MGRRGRAPHLLGAAPGPHPEGCLQWPRCRNRGSQVTRAPGTYAHAHPEPSLACQACHLGSVADGTLVPRELQWQTVGNWLALWNLSGELWPCSDILENPPVIPILERAAGLCGVPSLPGMKNPGWRGQLVTWLSALSVLAPPLLLLPEDHVNYVPQPPPPTRSSEHWGLTHLPRGRTLTRFCTSNSLSESLVSATAWL